MIDEVDEALRRLLQTHGLDGANVSFDGDSGGTRRGQSGRRVNLRLDDVTEDVTARAPCWEDVVEDGLVRWRIPPLRWYRLSYEVTAQANAAEAEHRLLSEVLRVLVLHDRLPADVLNGSLLELDVDVPLTVAAPRPGPRAATNPHRQPSLTLVVTAPLRPALRLAAAGPPETTRLEVRGGDAGPEAVAARPGDAAMRRMPVLPSTHALSSERTIRRGRRVPAPG